MRRFLDARIAVSWALCSCALGALATGCAPPASSPGRVAREERVTRRIVDAPTAANLPYSAAVVAGGLCFVAGQFGTDDANRPVGDVERQTALALDHLEAVLEKSGTHLDQVVRATVWLRRLDDFDAMNRAYRGRFPKGPPARVTVAVSDLLCGASVEIDAVAAMPDEGAR
jgi:2-iminobutanoate/2-iminopropanoate deaminase